MPHFHGSVNINVQNTALLGWNVNNTLLTELEMTAEGGR
jgi:hypothetical protein